jgi:predicted MFS family arabinose efflux permease
VTFTVIANWFQRDRARALARLTFYGAFASTVFYPLSAALIARDGWRGALVALALIQLAIAFPLHALVVRRHPEDHGLHPDGAAAADRANPLSGWTAPEALRSTSFWLITAAIALSTFATTAVLVLHVAYLLAQGYTLGTASTLAGLLGLAYLPGRWLFDRLAALVALPRLLAGAIALEALAVALLSAQRGLAWVVAYIIAFGVAYGAMAPLRGALIASFYGRRAYGTIIAAQGVALALAGAAGPAALGAVADRAGYGTALWSAVAVLVVGAAVALLAVCADDQRGRLQRSLPLRPVSGDKHGRGR